MEMNVLQFLKLAAFCEIKTTLKTFGWNEGRLNEMPKTIYWRLYLKGGVSWFYKPLFCPFGVPVVIFTWLPWWQPAQVFSTGDRLRLLWTRTAWVRMFSDSGNWSVFKSLLIWECVKDADPGENHTDHGKERVSLSVCSFFTLNWNGFVQRPLHKANRRLSALHLVLFEAAPAWGGPSILIQTLSTTPGRRLREMNTFSLSVLQMHLNDCLWIQDAVSRLPCERVEAESINCVWVRHKNKVRLLSTASPRGRGDAERSRTLYVEEDLDSAPPVCSQN